MAQAPRESPIARWGPLPAVLGAAAALGLLAWAKSYVSRPSQPSAMRASVTLDEAAYVTAVAPALRSAGCASEACHGRATSGLFLAPTLRDAASVVAEVEQVRRWVRAGAPSESALVAAFEGPHHGARVAAGRCEAGLVRRWVEGRAPGRCGR